MEQIAHGPKYVRAFDSESKCVLNWSYDRRVRDWAGQRHTQYRWAGALRDDNIVKWLSVEDMDALLA